jgi:osmoprotectant transport system permease protein
MEIFSELVEWFGEGSHWRGPHGVPVRVLEHVELFAAAVGLALLVAVPIGLYIGHARRGEFVAVSVANLGRAIPSFAILAIVFQLMLQLLPPNHKKLAFGFWPTVIALFLLAVPPILTNVYVGIQGVDADVVEAARGMGMSERQVLTRLEFPLAMPLIAAGIRTATLQVIATATLAALIAGGGLGRFIIDGFAQGDEPMIVAGAVLVALLAIVTDAVLGVVERAVRPRTTSTRTLDVDRPAPAEPVIIGQR